MKIVYFLLSLTLLSIVFAGTKKVIYSPRAPSPIGPYSQTIQYGEIIYLSGQIGLLASTGKLISDNVVEQSSTIEHCIRFGCC
jgi:enamine deaminase RidA (YjgF/YER057c/UK114 family)